MSRWLIDIREIKFHVPCPFFLKCRFHIKWNFWNLAYFGKWKRLGHQGDALDQEIVICKHFYQFFMLLSVDQSFLLFKIDRSLFGVFIEFVKNMFWGSPLVYFSLKNSKLTKVGRFFLWILVWFILLFILRIWQLYTRRWVVLFFDFLSDELPFKRAAFTSCLSKRILFYRTFSRMTSLWRWSVYVSYFLLCVF